MNWNEQGGAAFPFAATDPSNVELQSSGMSLRDYFAGQALAGLVAGYTGNSDMGGVSQQMWANEAYQYADAMLDARSSK